MLLAFVVGRLDGMIGEQTCAAGIDSRLIACAKVALLLSSMTFGGWKHACIESRIVGDTGSVVFFKIKFADCFSRRRRSKWKVDVLGWRRCSRCRRFLPRRLLTFGWDGRDEREYVRSVASAFWISSRVRAWVLSWASAATSTGKL